MMDSPVVWLNAHGSCRLNVVPGLCIAQSAHDYYTAMSSINRFIFPPVTMLYCDVAGQSHDSDIRRILYNERKSHHTAQSTLLEIDSLRLQRQSYSFVQGVHP